MFLPHHPINNFLQKKFPTFTCISNFIFGMFTIFNHVPFPLLHPSKKKLYLYVTKMFLERVLFRCTELIFMLNFRIYFSFHILSTTIITNLQFSPRQFCCPINLEFPSWIIGLFILLLDLHQEEETKHVHQFQNLENQLRLILYLENQLD